MKKLLMSCLILTFASGFAAAESYIGLFNDEAATDCYGDVTPYVWKMVHVIVYLEPEIASITAAEFRLDNMPESGDHGIVTENWDTMLVIGQSWWNIALAFQVPVPGPLAHLGVLQFFATDALWMGDDYVIAVRPGYAKDVLAVVDSHFIQIPVMGGQYTANCSDAMACECLEIVPVEAMNWSSVKALY